MPSIRHIQLFLLVLIVGFLTGPKAIEALQKLYPNDAQVEQAQLSAAVSESANFPPRAPEDFYGGLNLEAQSVFVWDINAHRELYGHNGQQRLPLASVTKMMTALVASEVLSPLAPITIASDDLRQEGDNGLHSGEEWKLRDLLSLTLVASSNDGASAIAEAAGEAMGAGAPTDPSGAKTFFVDGMNKKAVAIGLTDTHYRNESGLDLDPNASGAYGSARDMAILFEYIFKKHPEIFLSTAQSELTLTSESGFVHKVKNTNDAVGRLPGVIGSKTGFTDLAGGNLAVIVDVGVSRPVVIVVLGSTQEGRFTDVEKLLEATIYQITNS